jgi:4-amino-4-deoxy-L-arabinose transferase-like glycosyltransferase
MRGPVQGLVLALALAARLTLLLINLRHAEPCLTVSDSHSYITTAWSLAEHGAIQDGSGRGDWGRVPVYPLILAALFAAGAASPEALQGAILLQLLLGSLAVLLAARVAAHLAGPGAGLATGIILAVEPSLMAYSNIILSEIPYALALLAVLLIFRAYVRSLGRGLLVLLAGAVGMLPLIRPIGAFLPLLVAGLVAGVAWSRGRRKAAGVVLLFLAMLPSAAWCLRNQLLLGSAELHYTGPWGRAIFAHSVEQSVGIDSFPAAGVKPWEFGYWQESGQSAAQALRVQDDYFTRTLRGHPLAAARVLLRQGLLMLGVPDALLVQIAFSDPPDIPQGSVPERIRWALSLGPLGLLLLGGGALALAGFLALLAVPGVLRGSGPERGPLLLLLALLAAYHVALSSFVPFQAERYRVPMIPILAILLIVAVCETVRRRRFPLPALHLPAALRRDAAQGGVRSDRNRMAAARHQRDVGGAVAVGPGGLPVDAVGIRVRQDAPHLLFAAAVGAEQPGARLQGGAGADQLRDPQRARRVRQIEVHAGRDQDHPVALIGVPAQPAQPRLTKSRRQARARELGEEGFALRRRHVAQHA